MAKFLDKKQQVMDFQLTPYGKYKLGIGKFRPTYYAFYDSEVLYDKKYAQSGSDGWESLRWKRRFYAADCRREGIRSEEGRRSKRIASTCLAVHDSVAPGDAFPVALRRGVREVH